MSYGGKKYKIIIKILIILLRIIREFLFFIPHNVCRYYPSCKNYAEEALLYEPFHIAMIKIVIRIIKCNPLSRGGYDPVRK